MVYKVVLRFSPFQKSGSLIHFDYHGEEDGISDVELHDWNDDRKTRNLSVSWISTINPSVSDCEFRLVALKFGMLKDDSSLSCKERLYGFSEYRETATATFYNLPMQEYKVDDVVFAEIEVIELYYVPLRIQKSLKESLVKTSAQQKPITITRKEPLGVCMKKFLGTGEFSDVTLSDGTTDIKAHKLILSVHSPVFAKMFQNPMKENLESRVLIEDVPMGVLKTLLTFMYSEAIEVKDRTMVRELYIASDKYDVRNMRELCSDVLKSMDTTNVVETLLLADLHSDEVLKQAALDFAAEHFSELKSTEEWKNLLKENQTLYYEALSYVVDKKL